MTEQMKKYYEKRAQVLVKNLKSRHFDAYYCPDVASALEKALELIPEGASVGWGGALSAQQIGLIDAVKNGNYAAIDRDTAKSPEERNQLLKRCLMADVFLSGANALSLDGEMVNIDGTGNRVAAIAYGPETVLVIAGMNKVCDTLPENQLLGQSHLVECKQPATQVLQRGTDMIHIIVNDQESVMKTPPPHEEAGWCGQRSQAAPVV